MEIIESNPELLIIGFFVFFALILSFVLFLNYKDKIFFLYYKKIVYNKTIKKNNKGKDYE